MVQGSKQPHLRFEVAEHVSEHSSPRLTSPVCATDALETPGVS
jgi:hypothetical protein